MLDSLANTLCRSVLGVLSLEETLKLILHLTAAAEARTACGKRTKIIITLGVRPVSPGEENDSGVVEIDMSSLFEEVQTIQ